ncbi:putative metal homeostasis protein [Enterococcus sp. AZ128]
MEKTDISSAYRRLKSPNIKTRKRALKIIKEAKRNRTRK